MCHDNEGITSQKTPMGRQPQWHMISSPWVADQNLQDPIVHEIQLVGKMDIPPQHTWYHRIKYGKSDIDLYTLHCSKLRHPSILLLLAVCQTNSLNDLVLIYERVSYGSLYHYLHVSVSMMFSCHKTVCSIY